METETDQKLAYTPPNLTVHGTMKDITAANGGPGYDGTAGSYSAGTETS